VKPARAKRRAVIASTSAIALGFLLVSCWWTDDQGTCSLWASDPQFEWSTNGQNSRSVVSITVSNGGPRRLEFGLEWMECRARSDLSILTRDGPEGYWGRALAGGQTATWSKVISDGLLRDEDVLFCCRFAWSECEPRSWRLGQRIEELIGEIPFVSDMYISRLRVSRSLPWNSGSRQFASGSAFSSNVGTAEYFRLAYGWTPSTWPEQRARFEAVRTLRGDERRRLVESLADMREAGGSAARFFDSLSETNLHCHAEPVAPPEPPPRVSGSDVPDDRTLDSLPAPGSSGGR
jgi:hypothetical protein